MERREVLWEGAPETCMGFPESLAECPCAHPQAKTPQARQRTATELLREQLPGSCSLNNRELTGGRDMLEF